MPTRLIKAIAPVIVSAITEGNLDRNVDHLPLLMSHAKLYVFANAYLVYPLLRLAANRLDIILTGLSTLALANIDIAALIGYVYDNTPNLDLFPDTLRQVVMVYAANNLQELEKNDAFSSLLKEGGDFAKDLVSKLSKRLST
jgi:hypothetical protein